MAKIRRVGGVQAEMGKEVGLTKVTRNSAKSLWDAGVPVCMVGNKVNSHHFFGGWHLMHCADPTGREPGDFDRLANSFNFYLEPELGNRVAFFVRDKDLKRKGLAGARWRRR
jgi:hypothetical protein